MIVRIFKLAFSVSIVRIINVLGGFFSMMIVGYLGPNSLAAAVLAVLSVNTIFIINISMLQALTTLIRQYISQKKPFSEVGCLIKQSYIVALIGALISSLLLSQMDTLLISIGQDPKLILLTKEYFHYAAVAIFPALIIHIFSQINLGIGRYRIVLIIEIFSLALRLILGYGFILGSHGLPKLGLSGIAMADLSVNIIVSILIFFYIRISNFYKSMGLLMCSFHVDKAKLISIWKLGLPMAIQTGGELGAILTSIFLMGYYGVIPLAALQVSNQYLTLCMILGFGFSQAIALLVRESVYQTDHHRNLITQYIKTAVVMTLLCNIPIAILFLLYSQFLLSLFINLKQVDPLFLSYCKAFFTLNALIILLDSLRSVLTGALRGLNDATHSMFLGLFSLWCVAIPYSSLSLVADGGPIAIRLGVALGFVIWVALLSHRILKIMPSEGLLWPISVKVSQ